MTSFFLDQPPFENSYFQELQDDAKNKDINIKLKTYRICSTFLGNAALPLTWFQVCVYIILELKLAEIIISIVHWITSTYLSE